MTLSRREFLGVAGVALPATYVAAASPQHAGTRPATAPQRIGSFYPEVRDGENIIDLTRVAGRDAPAKGQIVRIGGRVLDRTGRPSH